MSGESSSTKFSYSESIHVYRFTDAIQSVIGTLFYVFVNYYRNI